MNLALIGGCLNNQQGLPRNLLYHSLLHERLVTGFPSQNIRISLGYYTSYNHLSKQATKLIDIKSPDAVFLFLRPFPLMALNKLWIKFDHGSGQMKRKFHPAFFNRKNMNWPAALTNYTLDNATIELRKEKFGLRDMNLLSGLVMGLNGWAVKYLLHEIETIQQFCTNKNCPLIVLSLPQNPESLVGNYVCRLVNTKLKTRLRDVPFIDIYSMDENYFEADGIHYNVTGHEALAQLLFSYIVENTKASSQTPPPIWQKQSV